MIIAVRNYLAPQAGRGNRLRGRFFPAGRHGDQYVDLGKKASVRDLGKKASVRHPNCYES